MDPRARHARGPHDRPRVADAVGADRAAERVGRHRYPARPAAAVVVAARAQRRPAVEAVGEAPRDPRRTPDEAGHPVPAQLQPEAPAAVVVGDAAPGEIGDERPTPRGVDPAAVGVRLPVGGDVGRDPDAAVLGRVDPAAVRLQRALGGGGVERVRWWQRLGRRHVVVAIVGVGRSRVPAQGGAALCAGSGHRRPLAALFGRPHRHLAADADQAAREQQGRERSGEDERDSQSDPIHDGLLHFRYQSRLSRSPISVAMSFLRSLLGTTCQLANSSGLMAR